MNEEARINLINEVIGFKEIPPNLLEEKYMLQIISAVQDAYSYIKSTQQKFECFPEIEINAFMQARLSNMIDSGHQLSEVVESVGRGSEIINVKGKKLENRPDLQFKIQSSIRTGQIVIGEAKIVYQIGGNWGKLELYCREGILRFVSGDYAWDESEAMMIGYVRDNSTINPTLTTFLNKTKKISNSKRFAVKTPPTSLPNMKGDVAYSYHDRRFKYDHNSNLKPGPIKIWHNWLN